MLSVQTSNTILESFRTASEVMLNHEATDCLMPLALLTAVSEFLPGKGPEVSATVTVMGNTGRR